MASDSLKKIQVKEFVKHREWKWDEKQETQKFWNSLLQEVFWVKSNEIKKVIDYEKTVKIDTTKYIDWYINDTKVLIEQKSHDTDLNKAEKQSDWAELTPYQQAKRYADNLPHSENPRWIITCNFQEFHIHDMEKERPQDKPEIVYLKDLPKEYHRLKFIIDSWDRNIKKEMELSIKAWEIVWKLYDSLAPLYKDITNPKSQKSLNVLCVRLVFCLYAEDAGVFWIKNLFHDYLNSYKTDDLRDALIKLFVVLDQKENERDQYLKEDLKKFPYVNWWLFADENIEIPNITEEVRDLLLRQASEDFDRSEISPTIFWAVFESTLNPETRRSGGMHYTSIENIHKVIDPLFLDDLNEELDGILKLTQPEAIRKKWKTLQQKMANLKFLDPACGSWNFLTETYLSLRRIENKIIKKEWKWVARLINPIEVNINQFYWIEINDFAVDVARTALWIAESQMMHETEEILWESLDFLPLKTNANIVKWNALRMDWNEVISNKECDYIMWNPPFIGHQRRTEEQQDDMKIVFSDLKEHGKLDYVCCRYNKACNYMKDTNIETALVSTNSICQWESVRILWQFLSKKGIEIQFAYPTFIRESEAISKAAVHCVIIGFSCYKKDTKKRLFTNEWIIFAKHINGYLKDSQDVYTKSRTKWISIWLPEMHKWSQPTDGLWLILEEDAYEYFAKNYPNDLDLVKRYMWSFEFINNKKRYCLRLKWISPNRYSKNKFIMERLWIVSNFRKTSKTESVRKYASQPYLFTQIRQPNCDYLAFPAMSSSKRKYMPIWYIQPDIIASNQLYLIPNANIYMFWVLTSNVHMFWMKRVCWRLKSDFRYAPAVYNNFPRPTPTEEQKKKIEQTAQAILDARKLHPDCSFADLYKNLTMPTELSKAHEDNDKAVMKAYWFNQKMSESEIVSKLMEMYEKLVNTK